jgi:hypothetical protein
MRYLAMLVACAVAAGVTAGAAAGARAEHVTIPIDEHFQDQDLTAACGTAIFVDFVAEAKVTLIRNKEGLIVREIDRVPGSAKITFSSAFSSFSFVAVPATLDYGDGAEVGSDVVVSVHGLLGHAPGFIASDAGLFRFLGEVTGFDEFGIPLVDFVEVIAERGNRASEEEIEAAICDALT